MHDGSIALGLLKVSSRGGDIDAGSRSLEFEDLTEAKQGALTNAFPVGLFERSLDLFLSDEKGCVFFRPTNGSLRSSRKERSNRCRQVAQARVEHLHELNRAAILKLGHTLDIHRLKVLEELILREGTSKVSFSIEHISDDQVSLRSLCDALSSGILGVGLQRTHATQVELVEVTRVTLDVGLSRHRVNRHKLA